jgi:hypothetical protein
MIARQKACAICHEKRKLLRRFDASIRIVGRIDGHGAFDEQRCDGENDMPSRPSFGIWLISTLIAAVVILMNYAGVAVPVISPIIAGHSFEALLIAYLLLWIGTVFTGL